MLFALCAIGEHLAALGAHDGSHLNEQAASHVVQLLVIQFSFVLIWVGYFSIS